MQYGFIALLLSLTLSACAANPAPLDKPYGGLPEQFLGYWAPDHPRRYCFALDIRADGTMNTICEKDGKIIDAERYRFDCSPDPRTAFIAVEISGSKYTPYYKLVINDKYKHDEDNLVFLKIHNVGDAALRKEKSERYPRCDKTAPTYFGPEGYMRKASEMPPLQEP